MSMIEALSKRRTYYNIEKSIPVSEETLLETIDKVVELVPDANNMKSARVVVALGKKQDELWDLIYDVYGGQVSREKIDSFKKGYGTILYFYDNAVLRKMQEKIPLFADNFPLWANQANGMLQFSLWTALRELNIGASLQHYNPIIDIPVKKLFDLPPEWKLVAQMPFGSFSSEPEAKPAENIRERVLIAR